MHSADCNWLSISVVISILLCLRARSDCVHQIPPSILLQSILGREEGEDSAIRDEDSAHDQTVIISEYTHTGKNPSNRNNHCSVIHLFGEDGSEEKRPLRPNDEAIGDMISVSSSYERRTVDHLNDEK